MLQEQLFWKDIVKNIADRSELTVLKLAEELQMLRLELQQVQGQCSVVPARRSSLSYYTISTFFSLITSRSGISVDN